MGKPKAPEPPDYSGVAAASEKAAKLQYKLGQRQLEWAKKQYRSDKTTYRKIVNSFLADQREASANAKEDRDFYEKNYRPLEEAAIKEAQNYDNAERRTKEMGAAQSVVAQQFDAQRDNAQRELEAYGIDPSSARYGALDIGVRAAQAAAQAAAGTQASNRVEDVGRALRADAINIGRGYPTQIAQSYATASQMGQGAGQLTGQKTEVGANTMGTAPQYFSGQNNSLNTWGNTLNMGYQNALAGWQAEQQASSGWGSALGLIGGFATKAFGFEDGGEVPEYALNVERQPDRYVDPGMSPSGGENVDDVPARLNAGEFVIPDDVVSWYGLKHMHGMIEKAKKERVETEQQTEAIPTQRPAIAAPAAFSTT